LYTTYQRLGLCLEDFEGTRYKRLDHIRHLLGCGALDATLRWQTSPASDPLRTTT
jgi:hypothetical protein